MQSHFLLLLWNNRNKSNAPSTVPRLQQIFWNSLFLYLPPFFVPCWKKVQRIFISHERDPHARETLLNWKFSSEEAWGSLLDLFVIIDQSHHVLPCLFEKILLHTLPYVMMKESSFLVHQVVFPGEHRPSVSHSCVVADHHHRPVRFCQITARHGRGWLIVNTYLRMHLFLFSNKSLKLFRSISYQVLFLFTQRMIRIVYFHNVRLNRLRSSRREKLTLSIQRFNVPPLFPQ